MLCCHRNLPMRLPRQSCRDTWTASCDRNRQIILSPVAPICCKAIFPRVYPCVETVETRRDRARLIFIDQQRGMRPSVGRRPHSIPIGMPALGENENHGPSVVREISLMSRCIRRKISFVELVKSGESIVGRSASSSSVSSYIIAMLKFFSAAIAWISA